MNSLYNFIIKHISTNEYISLDYYMLLVAEYYYGNLKKFGMKSDFITAPEISSIFGMTLGKWLKNNHVKLNSPKEFSIVELGAGSGKLLKDILSYLGDEFLNNHRISVSIVEKSDSLTKLQSFTLQHFKTIDIKWHKEIENLPQTLTFIIANEFFDALPIKQYKKQENDWQEVVIKFNTAISEFYFDKIKINSTLNQQLINKYPNAYENAILEQASPYMLKSFSYLCNHLKANNGGMLLIDYGYEYNPQTRIFFNSTLQAIKGHKFNNIFENIGSADITAHIDFYELIKIAQNTKCQTNSSVTQANFLFKTGITEIVNKHINILNFGAQSKLNFSLNKLLSPEQMGSVFRALEVFSNN